MSLELGKYFPIEAIFHVIRLKHEGGKGEIVNASEESGFFKSLKFDYDKSIEALKTLAFTPGYRFVKLYIFLNYEEDFLRNFILSRIRTDTNKNNPQGEEEPIDPKAYNVPFSVPSQFQLSSFSKRIVY